MARFGPIPLRRVRFEPAPGTATEQDVLDLHSREDRLYELTEGMLIAKDWGVQESYLGALLGAALQKWARDGGVGFVLGADGMVRLAPGLIRVPDASLVSWDRMGSRRVPRLPLLPVAPDLVVEVLSPGNTPQEMDRKRQDYFQAGVALVWYVDPENRLVHVFEPSGRTTLLHEGQDLAGGPLLPGFVLPLHDLFSTLER